MSLAALKSVVRHLPFAAAWRQRRWNAAHLGLRQTKSGLSIPVQSFADWIIYREIFEQYAYRRPIEDFLEAARRNSAPLVFDLGANVGYFMLHLADQMRIHGLEPATCRVIAIEGLPATCATLRERLAVAGLFPHGKILLGLVGDRTGNAVILPGVDHFASKVGGADAKGVKVNFIDLERLLPVEARIDLLKCDIEGAEETFLRNYGTLLRRTDRLCIEIHDERRRDVSLVLIRQAGLISVELLSEEGTGADWCGVYFARRKGTEADSAPSATLPSS
jgi:FkbM family methyltransferase